MKRIVNTIVGITKSIVRWIVGEPPCRHHHIIHRHYVLVKDGKEYPIARCHKCGDMFTVLGPVTEEDLKNVRGEYKLSVGGD